MKADINILDYDNLRLRAPEVVYDLPAGGKRLVQRTDGFDATIVSGAGRLPARRGDRRIARAPGARGALSLCWERATPVAHHERHGVPRSQP